jgi:hypothetical protein
MMEKIQLKSPWIVEIKSLSVLVQVIIVFHQMAVKINSAIFQKHDVNCELLRSN